MPLLLCSMPFSPEQVEALHGATVVLAPDAAAFAAALPEAEIVVGRLSPGGLAAAGRLRWLQVPFTGVEDVPLRALAARGILVTNIHEQAESMADHALMLLLALNRSLADCVRGQQEARWGRGLPVGELAGRSLLAAGFGAVGRGIAARARACGMRTVALRRHVAPDPDCDEVIGPGALLATLPRIDAVVNSLPLTAATRGMFDAAAFAALPPGALYINVGRGATSDEAALAAALASGHLGGAGLDVFAAEPLPAGHPLWRAPRTIITPHLGGHQRDRLRRVHALVAENLGRYLRGEPLRNVVDTEAGY